VQALGIRTGKDALAKGFLILPKHRMNGERIISEGTLAAERTERSVLLEMKALDPFILL
jgi:hypothetical protein